MRRLLNSAGEKTQQGNVLGSSLFRTLREGVAAWISDAEDGALKEVHHASLLGQRRRHQYRRELRLSHQADRDREFDAQALRSRNQSRLPT